MLPERYDNGGFSGGTLDRPALQRLLADIDAGRVRTPAPANTRHQAAAGNVIRWCQICAFPLLMIVEFGAWNQNLGGRPALGSSLRSEPP